MAPRKKTKHATTAAELLELTKESIIPWVNNNSNKERLYNSELDELNLWLNNDPELMKIPNIKNRLFSNSGFINTWALSKYVADTLSFSSADVSWLQTAQHAQSISLICSAILRALYPNGGMIFWAENFAWLLARTITIGWKEEAEFFARIGFDNLGNILNGSVATDSLPLFVIELVKNWLGAHHVALPTYCRSRKIITEGMCRWQPLFDGWREQDPHKFDKLMYEAAELHIAESREANDALSAKSYPLGRYEVEDDTYWVWPIELLAVLRLREWEGLTNPPMTHPLFSVSALGRLEPPLERKFHPVLEAAQARFGKEHPNMFTLADLPRLRREQGEI